MILVKPASLVSTDLDRTFFEDNSPRDHDYVAVAFMEGCYFYEK